MLLQNGKETGCALCGTNLILQYQTDDHFLFVTDYDCPYEELTSIYLLDPQLRIKARRHLPAFLLSKLEWHSPTRFDAISYSEKRIAFTIRSWRIPYLRSQLGIIRK